MDMKDRNAGGSKRGKAVDRVVLYKRLSQLPLRHPIGSAGPPQPRVAGQVTDRVDPRDTANLFRVFRRPAIEHQAAPAAGQQGHLRVEALIFHQLFIERGISLSPGRATIGLANVNPCNGNPGTQEPLKHPGLRFTGQVRPQGGGVKNPGNGLYYFLRGSDHEGGASGYGKRLLVNPRRRLVLFRSSEPSAQEQ